MGTGTNWPPPAKCRLPVQTIWRAFATREMSGKTGSAESTQQVAKESDVSVMDDNRK